MLCSIYRTDYIEFYSKGRQTDKTYKPSAVSLLYNLQWKSFSTVQVFFPPKYITEIRGMPTVVRHSVNVWSLMRFIPCDFVPSANISFAPGKSYIALEIFLFYDGQMIQYAPAHLVIRECKCASCSNSRDYRNQENVCYCTFIRMCNMQTLIHPELYDLNVKHISMLWNKHMSCSIIRLHFTHVTPWHPNTLITLITFEKPNKNFLGKF